ncbi:hypothetical protein G6F31_021728 [Rhizopus arrhizus]|nr:hypothetical protein G6F31_021728 [Rhizopus arrhizus]
MCWTACWASISTATIPSCMWWTAMARCSFPPTAAGWGTRRPPTTPAPRPGAARRENGASRTAWAARCWRAMRRCPAPGGASLRSVRWTAPCNP